MILLIESNELSLPGTVPGTCKSTKPHTTRTGVVFASSTTPIHEQACRLVPGSTKQRILEREENCRQ